MSQTMLYKFPGAHDIHGSKFDYLIVADEDIEKELANGWFLTTGEAKEAGDKPPASAEPTRAEMEAKATELGIKFDGRTSDKSLLDKIDAKA